MIKKLLCLTFIFTFQFLIAQETKISVSFDDTPLLEALSEIEKKGNFHFYYLQDWLKNETVSGEFTQTETKTILEEILAETQLNFQFMENGRIILTRNNAIYDELPQSFSPEKNEELSENEPSEPARKERPDYNPVFYGSEEAPRELETVFIGRENKSNPRREFKLSGYITDIETGMPVPNLSIITEDGNKGATTDMNGYYEINLPAGSSVLNTTSMGYEDVQREVVIYNDGKLNFELKEQLEELGEVVLDADADRNVRSALTGVERINVENIKNIPLVLGERDILKVATTLPGISTAGEGAAGYNVRGGKTDQNLILLDDAVIYNPAHFFGIFSGINPFTTGEVDIYKGNIPSEYGGRLSSVFDIRSKDANTKEFAGEASIGPVTSNLALEIPIVEEKSGLLLGGRSTYSDWILRSLDDAELESSSASFFDVIAKYHHDFHENTKFKATGYFSKDNFSITSDSLFNYQNLVFSANLHHKFNNQHSLEAIVSNSGYDFNIDYESEFNEDFRSGYTINETEAKVKMNYRPGGKHTFNYGVSGKLYRVDPGNIEPLGESTIDPLKIPGEKGLEAALFIGDSYKVSEKLLIDAGLRFSMFSALGPKEQNIYEEGLPRNENTLVETRSYGPNEFIETYGGPEVRFSARYNLSPDFSTKLSYNNTYQYIHTLSNNTTVSPTDTYKLSDVNVAPQRASQYALGFYKNFKDNRYEISLEGYYKTSKNILDYKVGAQLFLNENIEAEVLQGEGRAYGAEFLLKKTEGRLNGWLGYTYSRSLLQLDGEFNEELVNNGEYFPANFDKPHDVSLVANYKLTKRFSFSANFVYQTGRPVTIPVGKYTQNNSEYVVYSDRNQFRIPDYYRLDLSFNVEGNHKIEKLAHSFWNISVYNVLGRNNPYSVFFVNDGGEIQAYQSSIFAIPVPTITYNFKF